MNILILTSLLVLSKVGTSAYVQTLQCKSSSPKPFEDSSKIVDSYSQISLPIAQVVLKDLFLIYRLEFTANSVVNDVNYTTNLYTTLNIQTKFIGGEVYQKTLRLCDYITSPFDNNSGTVYSNYESDMDEILQELPNLLTPFGTDLTSELSSDTVTPPANLSENSTYPITQTDILSDPPKGTPLPSSSFPSVFSPPSSLPKPPAVSDKSDSPTNTTDIPDNFDTALPANRNNQPLCPLQPQQRYQFIYIAKIDRARYFGSYQTRFNILSADIITGSIETSENSTTNEVSEHENNLLGCVEVLVTPYHPIFITYPICFVVMFIFVIGLCSSFYIYHNSPNQESDNVLLIQASSICNGPLLNDLTPDVSILLNFLQFVLLTMCLNLDYPGFLQPILSFMNWCSLIRVDLFNGGNKDSRFINPISQDGIYQSLGRYGLLSIFPQDYSSNNFVLSGPPSNGSFPGSILNGTMSPPLNETFMSVQQTLRNTNGTLSHNPTYYQLNYGEMISDLWRNFVIWLWCVVLFFGALGVLFILIKQRYILKKEKLGRFKTKNLDNNVDGVGIKSNRVDELKKVWFYFLGIVVQFFYVYFPLPFISITSFLILGLCLDLKVDIICSIFGILFFIIWLSFLLWFIIRFVIFDATKLYSSFKVISIWSSVYNWYKPLKSWFLIIDKGKWLFEGIVIGFGQQNGVVQLVLLLVIEIAYVCLLVYYQPFFNKLKNIWSCFISVVCILLLMLSISYIRELQVNIIAKSIIADVQLMIIAMVIFMLLVFFMVRMGQIHKSKKKLSQPLKTNKLNESQTKEYAEIEEDVIEKINETEYQPTKISPITDEYLASMDKQDQMLKRLWRRRIDKPLRLQAHDWIILPFGRNKQILSDDIRRPVGFKSVLKNSDDGFCVMGRKPIAVKNSEEAAILN